MTTETAHTFEHIAPAPYTFDRVEISVWRATPDAHAQPGSSCDHCGTAIMYLFWFFAVDGQRFKVGCDCAMKAHPSTAKVAQEWKRKHAAELRAARREMTREKRQAQWALEGFLKAQSFVRTNPRGLALLRALHTDHSITRDMRANLLRWGQMSEKAIDFALKLASEATQPKPEFASLPDCSKRVHVEGSIISTKWKLGDYGEALKMLVEWKHEGGTSKVWGTVPVSIFDAFNGATSTTSSVAVEEWLKGKTVKFDAKIKPSNDDPSFGFFSRPTKGEVA